MLPFECQALALEFRRSSQPLAHSLLLTHHSSLQDPPLTKRSRAEELAERLRPRREVEQLFASTGRTFRRNHVQLWYHDAVEPRLLKAGLQAAGLYRRGVENALGPVVRQLRLYFEALPAAFDGFRILHLSDFHIDGNEALAARLSELLAGLNADLCVLTGDYRFEVHGPCDAAYPLMRSILANVWASSGIAGILGNHDAAEIAFALEEMDVRMLVNESLEIRRGSSSLWLVGTDDSFDYRCDDLDGALAGVPADAFKILLAHSPDLYAKAASRGIDLYLCGHTHAGQIRLPVIGSLRHNAKVPREYSYGYWRHGKMQAYTTAGVGCSGVRVRYNCPPEAVLIELRAARPFASC